MNQIQRKNILKGHFENLKIYAWKLRRREKSERRRKKDHRFRTATPPLSCLG
jgi:hypothetical protein